MKEISDISLRGEAGDDRVHGIEGIPGHYSEYDERGLHSLVGVVTPNHLCAIYSQYTWLGEIRTEGERESPLGSGG